MFKQVLAAGPSAETWEAPRPFPETRKTLFFAIFFTVFLRVIFHRGFGWNCFIGALGGNCSFGALGGRFEACTSKELELGIRRNAPASPLSGAVGGAKPSGLREVISYFSKMKICTENRRLVPAMAGIYFIPVLVQVRL